MILTRINNMFIFFKFTVLNASHNRMLSNVPFLLCKKTANIEIDLSNTLFSQHVNWSGQIIRQRNTLDAEFPEISQGWNFLGRNGPKNDFEPKTGKTPQKVQQTHAVVHGMNGFMLPAMP